MDLDYQHKYLKYKQKYLDLKYKEYSGGGWLDFLKSKKTIALNAVNKDGYNLYKLKDFQNDKDVVLAAVQQNGFALKYASEELKKDREIVLAAVRQNGYALEYASELKKDREIVLAAVRQNGYALEYASEHLKADRMIVLVAIKNNNMDALQYIPINLRKEVKQKAIELQNEKRKRNILSPYMN